MQETHDPRLPKPFCHGAAPYCRQLGCECRALLAYETPAENWFGEATLYDAQGMYGLDGAKVFEFPNRAQNAEMRALLAMTRDTSNAL